MPIKYEGLFRLYPVDADTLANGKENVVAVFRRTKVATGMASLVFKTPEAADVKDVKNENIGDHWCMALPDDAREYGRAVVRNFYCHRKAGVDICIAQRLAGEEIVSLGLSQTVVMDAIDSFNVEKKEKARLRKAFAPPSLYAYPVAPDALKQGSLPRGRVSGVLALAHRACALFL